ncbi:MAG: HDIG domain-containing protein, partial [bacterium]
ERGMDEPLMEHTMDVLDRTLELYQKWGGDLKLLIAGALLHDIGRTVTHGVEHGVEGAKLVREQGWHEEVAKIVERHMGGGITKEEAQEQGLPSKDYVPETLEERLVCFADKTAGGRDRFQDMLKRTEEAGFKESAERMRELAEEFEY